MTKKNGNNRSTRGFTLLEVLIAVLILGIIATAAMPLLGSYTEQAREAREAANMIVKAQAIDRYVADHKVGLGMVYVPSDSSLVTYGLETMQGPTAQLLLPTDVNGNVMDDPMTASPGPYSYGPYLAQLPPEPAALLLAAADTIRGEGEYHRSLTDNPQFVVVEVEDTESTARLRIRALQYRVRKDRLRERPSQASFAGHTWTEELIELDPWDLGDFAARRHKFKETGTDTLFQKIVLAMGNSAAKVKGEGEVGMEVILTQLKERIDEIGDRKAKLRCLVKADLLKDYYQDVADDHSFPRLVEGDLTYRKWWVNALPPLPTQTDEQRLLAAGFPIYTEWCAVCEQERLARDNGVDLVDEIRRAKEVLRRDLVEVTNAAATKYRLTPAQDFTSALSLVSELREKFIPDDAPLKLYVERLAGGARKAGVVARNPADLAKAPYAGYLNTPMFPFDYELFIAQYSRGGGDLAGKSKELAEKIRTDVGLTANRFAIGLDTTPDKVRDELERGAKMNVGEGDHYPVVFLTRVLADGQPQRVVGRDGLMKIGFRIVGLTEMGGAIEDSLGFGMTTRGRVRDNY